MESVKEITVFCEQGDSAKLSTWSNVPYFLTKALLDCGIKVNRVDLSPKANILHKIVYKLWNAFVKGVLRGRWCATYRRSRLYFFLSELKIKRSVRRYPDADILLFTSFSYPVRKISAKPVVIFCDWTLEYDCRFFQGLAPESLPASEKAFIRRQDKCMETADFVVSLFPGVAEYLKSRYANPNIFYLGNVVNALYEPAKELIREKERRCDILFIGKKHYRKGAEELIDAFRTVREKRPEARLHIVGMPRGMFGALPEGVECYGYLAKESPSQCEKYYELLSKCRLFINTTPKWGAFSASVEAMYYFTPVILTPYSEFVKTFGDEISFGMYHTDRANLAGEIETMLSDEGFSRKAVSAHEAVASMTWDNFVKRLLDITETGR